MSSCAASCYWLWTLRTSRRAHPRESGNALFSWAWSYLLYLVFWKSAHDQCALLLSMVLPAHDQWLFSWAWSYVPCILEKCAWPMCSSPEHGLTCTWYSGKVRMTNVLFSWAWSYLHLVFWKSAHDQCALLLSMVLPALGILEKCAWPMCSSPEHGLTCTWYSGKVCMTNVLFSWAWSYLHLEFWKSAHDQCALLLSMVLPAPGILEKCARPTHM